MQRLRVIALLTIYICTPGICQWVDTLNTTHIVFAYLLIYYLGHPLSWRCLPCRLHVAATRHLCYVVASAIYYAARSTCCTPTYPPLAIMPHCPQCPTRWFRTIEGVLRHASHPSSGPHEYCSFCNRQFPHANAWIQHARAKHIMSPYFCHPCEREIATRSDLEAHWTNYFAHPNCPKCRQGFPDNMSLEHHLSWAHRVLTCDPCKGRIVEEETLEKHYLSSPNHPTCVICNLGFRSDDDYNKHLTSEHSNLYCGPCRRQFWSTHHLEEHFKSSRNHPTCKYCDVGFIDDQMANLHKCPVILRQSLTSPRPVLDALDMTRSYITNNSSVVSLTHSAFMLESSVADQSTPSELRPMETLLESQAYPLNLRHSSPAPKTHVSPFTNPLSIPRYATPDIPRLVVEKPSPQKPVNSNTRTNDLVLQTPTPSTGPMHTRLLTYPLPKDVKGPFSPERSSPPVPEDFGLPHISPITPEPATPCYDDSTIAGSPIYILPIINEEGIECVHVSRDSIHKTTPSPLSQVAHESLSEDITDAWPDDECEEDKEITIVSPTANRTSNTSQLEVMDQVPFPMVSPTNSIGGGVGGGHTTSSLTPLFTDLSATRLRPRPRAKPRPRSDVIAPPAISSSTSFNNPMDMSIMDQDMIIQYRLSQCLPPPSPTGSVREIGLPQTFNNTNSTANGYNNEKAFARLMEGYRQLETIYEASVHAQNEIADKIRSSSSSPISPAASASAAAHSSPCYSSRPTTPPAPRESLHCRICLAPSCTEMTATMCGHVFCKSCITEEIVKTSKCPVCESAQLLYCLFKLDLSV